MTQYGSKETIDKDSLNQHTLFNNFENAYLFYSKLSDGELPESPAPSRLEQFFHCKLLPQHVVPKVQTK